MSKKKPKLINAVIDFETDPFRFGRVPRPFACEFYSDDVCEVFWGDDCVERFIAWLEKQSTPYRIYAHNGGKFDFHFLHQYLDNPIRVINSRIVQASLFHHTLRDSLAIIPVPLKRFFKGSKGEIDYRLMEREHREKHKAAILDYLHQDCTSLYKVVCAFVDRFGPKLTVGSTAIDQLNQRHEYETTTPAQDALIRPFYYGGRVQCFKSGILQGPWINIDVNSMYPKAMRDYKHPATASFHIMSRMPDNFDMPFFVEFTGSNDGALPFINEDNQMTFQQRYGTFQACSHELAVALDYGLVKIDKVHRAFVPGSAVSFKDFVDTFYAEKVAAKQNGDEMSEMFSKFMLNSAYGKFGTNPANFSDWYINRDFGNDLALIANGYRLECEYDEFELWSRPADLNDTAFYNVAIAASITSAARAILLDGIQHAVEPIYCDTDSLICKGFAGEISDTTLGAWKLEKTAPVAAIAGKKLYALYDPATLALPERIYNNEWNEWEPNPARRPLKLSSKGGQLSVDDIIAICQGRSVRYENEAPTFSLYGDARFIARKFAMTAENYVDAEGETA